MAGNKIERKTCLVRELRMREHKGLSSATDTINDFCCVAYFSWTAVLISASLQTEERSSPQKESACGIFEIYVWNVCGHH